MQKAFVTKTKMEALKSVQLKTDLPAFKPGDKLVIQTKIKEGDKERIQNYEGVCVARSGRGVAETFTVRKISFGVGVERVFPLNSPNIAAITVESEGFVRRAKLFYLRELSGKKARIKDKRLKLSAALGATNSASKPE